MGPALQQDDEGMASINVTPLTDVLLVLLIIFMIAASAIQRERIRLPMTRYKARANETDLVISIRRDRSVSVGAITVPLNQLEAYLENLGADTDKVIVKSDESVPYGIVAQTMDAAKSAGLNNISLATKPIEEKGEQSQ